MKHEYYEHCYEGLTLKIDFSNAIIPKVTIEGREFTIEGHERLKEELNNIPKPNEISNLKSEERKSAEKELRKSAEKEFQKFAEKVIKRSPAYKKRKKIRKDHFKKLKQGVSAWNEWREKHPEIRPILYGRNLTESNLSFPLYEVDFSNAELVGSNLSKQKLMMANFHEANLKEAILQEANLIEANLCRANLYKTNLKKATLTKANLQGAQLANTNLKGADLNGCKVFGASAWDLNLPKNVKNKMTFKYGLKNKEKNDKFKEKWEMTVDNLEAAQLIFLLVDNPKIYELINSVKDKVVLILGRFTKKRKEVLDAIRENLRKRDLVPIIFDFKRPEQLNFTETIMTLAGMSKFIIADITKPSSSPLELQATMPDYMIPFVVIIKENEIPFAMFQDLQQKYEEWVLDVLIYDKKRNLVNVMKEAVVDPAIEKADQLIIKKNRKIRFRHVKEYIK